MADWDDWDGGDFAADNNADGGDWDGGGDWDDAPAENKPAATKASGGGDWEQDDWETQPDPEAVKKQEQKQQKKTLKQVAKEKEEQEKREKEEKEKQEKEALKRAMQDPDYAKKKKEMDRLAVERSELDLICDFFGTGAGGPSTKDEMRKEANPERARALAACTGLMDGADGNDSGDDFIPDQDVDIFAISNNKGNKKAAPNALDAIEFNTDEDVKKFVELLVRKVQDVGTKTNTNNTQTMSKVLVCELARQLGPGMKQPDVDEVLRLTTVVKNDMLKSQSTKNPKKKNKKTLKTHDNGRDFSDDDY